MTTRLHLAGPDDRERVLKLMADFAAEVGLPSDPQRRAGALAPLLEGSAHGAVYTIGPPRAPVGYVAISFGWSMEFGGLDGIIDELYIRPAVRGRGMATDVLYSLPKALKEAGVKAIHLEAKRANPRAAALYARAGFAAREDYFLMSRLL